VNLLTVYDQFSGCSWYRNVVPGYAAKIAGHEVRLRAGEVSGADLEWCDALFVQRLWQPVAIQIANDAKRLGKLTVWDLDDDLWALDPANPAKAFWDQHADDALAVMRAFDRVTTTNKYLAGTLRRWHKDVRIIPNALPDDFVRFGPEHVPPLAIGWAGGYAHSDDLRAIEKPLLDVLDARPDVMVALVGSGEWIRHERVLHLSPVAIERYHTLLSTFDIGLAPILDTRFNRAKSDLKPLEYAAVGVPCIASKVGPYRELKANTLLAPSPKEFRSLLLHLIDHPEKRAALTEAGLAWADSRRISQVLPLWEAAWTR
jgi:glycosyltransferase involved in cell wall biosynthesis